MFLRSLFMLLSRNGAPASTTATYGTNLGPLRYVFVTPQSHRIHHANNLEYRDRNFGSIFSIWDFAFSTQVRVYDEYPETGIDDTEFPLETSANPVKLLIMPVVQMVYCFSRAGQLVARVLAVPLKGR